MNSNPVPTRFLGFWMAIFVALYLLFNVFRAVNNPQDFAQYFYGIPTNSEDSFVLVYAIRTGFLGLLVAIFLLRKQYTALTLYAGFAALIPLSDAFLVAYQSGHLPTVIRHFVVTGFMLLTTFFLTKLSKSAIKSA